MEAKIETYKKTQNAQKPQGVLEGVKDSLPIALGYIPIAITFGLLAKSYGIPNFIIVMMSIVIYAGSSQFVGIKLISMGVAYPEIILTTFIINFRNFLISSAMSQRMEKGISSGKKFITGYMVTDETFALVSSKGKDNVSFSYAMGLQGFLFLAFNFGTFLGAYAVSSLSPVLMNSLGIAIYAMFISILLPSVKKSRSIALICILSMSMATLMSYAPLGFEISTGWIIVISSVGVSCFGGYLYTKGAK